MIVKPPTYENDLQYITEVLWPEWLKLFTHKNADYQGDSGDLGTAGGFVDIWRKSKKLKRALWDKKPIRGEQPREVVMDLIGHAFLLLIDIDAETQQRKYERASAEYQQAKAMGDLPKSSVDYGVVWDGQ